MKKPKASRTLTSRRFAFRAAYAIDRAVALLPVSQPPVLITGFWRSGTTWVQEVVAEALGAKTIFEPFSPKAKPPFNDTARFHDRDQQRREAYMPLDLAALSHHDLKFLDAIFAGACPSRFAFLCRTSVAESLRRRTVVKLVRGPFILPDLIDRYALRAVHVSRHPGAVVASFLNTDWDWTFDDVKFADILPRPEEVSLALQGDVAKLRAYDEKPAYERIAAYWAFTEKQVAKFHHDHLLKVTYEALVLEGHARFAAIVNFLEGAPARFETERHSAVTVSNRLHLSKSERIDSWRKTLSPEMQQRISAIVADFWPEGARHWFSQEGGARVKSRTGNIRVPVD